MPAQFTADFIAHKLFMKLSTLHTTIEIFIDIPLMCSESYYITAPSSSINFKILIWKSISSITKEIFLYITGLCLLKGLSLFNLHISPKCLFAIAVPKDRHIFLNWMKLSNFRQKWKGIPNCKLLKYNFSRWARQTTLFASQEKMF